MFLKPDGTFWIQLVNFVIFFALLNVVFLRPVSAAIKKRRDYLNSLTDDYETYKHQAHQLQAQEDAIRAAARREAELTLSKARAEISNETAALAAQFGAQAAKKIEEAQLIVESELLAARKDEAQTVRELAELMLDRTVSEAAR
ncbi:MAG: hypothetical protein NVS9B12_09760 [Vulcanimicrobiaceae bacterium]